MIFHKVTYLLQALIDLQNNEFEAVNLWKEVMFYPFSIMIIKTSSFELLIETGYHAIYERKWI